MREMIKDNLRYSIEGSSAIKLQVAEVYDFPASQKTTPKTPRLSQRLDHTLEHSSPVYRELKTGSCRGIPLAGVTLAQKVYSGILASTLTVAIILVTYLL